MVLVDKLIAEDRARQQALCELAMQFEKACEAKDNLRQAYEKCNDIPLENHAQIEILLNEESTKDYDMHNALFSKVNRKIN